MELSGQFRQSELPIDDLYFPEAHCVHSAPSCPVQPALHLQDMITVPAGSEMELSGQFRQAELPVDDLYFPETHFVHPDPSCPVHPTLHLQDIIPVLVGTEMELSGQETHSAPSADGVIFSLSNQALLTEHHCDILFKFLMSVSVVGCFQYIPSSSRVFEIT
jgi:hypothetical protein